MTKEAPPKTAEVAIEELLRDPRYQVRKKLDDATVGRYAKNYRAGTPMPPVKVAMVGGVPVVIDGWHRLAALDTLGILTVDVEVIEATPKEARWLAAKANLAHGLPLKGSELREVFRAYVRAGEHLETTKHGKRLKSYRAIGAELGRTHPTIRAWMQRDFPRIARKYSNEENAKMTGGVREVDPEEEHAETVRNKLNDVLAASRGVKDEALRAELAVLAARVAEQLRKAAEDWEPKDYFDSLDF